MEFVINIFAFSADKILSQASESGELNMYKDQKYEHQSPPAV